MENANHTSDKDCKDTMDYMSGECRVCHAVHTGDICSACGGDAYHESGCRFSDAA